MSAFDVRFDVVEVEELRKRIDSIDDATLGDAVKRAVNEVAARTYSTLIPRMTKAVALTEQFVRERVVTTPAVTAGPRLIEASIVAPIAKGSRLIKVNPVVTLRRFSPQQETAPVRWANGSFTPWKKGLHPTKPGSYLPWKPRTGDRLRGIPADMKASGVSVEVLRGRRKRIATAFLLPLRRGNEAGGNGLGVVQRGDDGKIRSLKGPMPYQIMRGLLPEIVDDVERDLRETTTRLVVAELDKALAQ